METMKEIKIEIKKEVNGQIVEHIVNWYDSVKKLVEDFNTFGDYYFKLATIKQNNGEWCYYCEEDTPGGRKITYQNDSQLNVEISWSMEEKQ